MHIFNAWALAATISVLKGDARAKKPLLGNHTQNNPVINGDPDQIWTSQLDKLTVNYKKMDFEMLHVSKKCLIHYLWNNGLARGLACIFLT